MSDSSMESKYNEVYIPISFSTQHCMNISGVIANKTHIHQNVYEIDVYRLRQAYGFQQ